MEIDITAFFTTECPRDYFASVAEIGNNAAFDTWHAALEATDEYQFLATDEAKEAFREYIANSGFGREEVFAMDDRQLNALFIQDISSAIREGGLKANGPDSQWDAYYQASENGEVSGRLFKGDDGKIYCTLD